MANEKIPVIDPDNVPEIICDGRLNVHWAVGRATITFTHNRPRTKPLLEDGQVEFDAVVRARIATSVANILALRDLLNRIFPEGQSVDAPVGGSAGGSVH
jgi:hypothetical protein